MNANANQTVLIPVKLDAFILNEKVCEGGGDDAEIRRKKAKIAPISQPNYSFLRLDEKYLQSDILYHVDLHNACPADLNSRITDLGNHSRRLNRQGVYLHWTIPRVYRSGKTDPNQSAADGNLSPVFPEVPTRWLVVRHIHDLDSVQPLEAKKKLKRVSAWVVESDRCRTLDGERNPDTLKPKDPQNILPDDLDLQVDVSPFISASNSVAKDGKVIGKQAEIFIGDKTDASKWTETALEDGRPDPEKMRVNLQLLASSNELFPDYQPHCSNVFSIVDNFEYDKTTEGPLYATHAVASYSVIGWNSRSPNDIVQPRQLAPSERKPKDPEKKMQSRKQRLAELDMVIKGFPEGTEDVPKQIADWFDEKLLRTGGTRSLCHGAMYEVRWDIKEAPEHVLADHYADLLAKTLPVAVGTTPMDALMAYAGAHECIDRHEPGQELPRKIEHALKRLETLLLSRDDGVESQTQALDLMYNWNYLRVDGGDNYHVSGRGGKDGKPVISPDKQVALIRLNQLCRFRDAALRRLKRERWGVFSEWWKVVTNASTNSQAIKALKPILESIENLENALDTHKKEIQTLGGEQSNGLEPGVHAPFQQQRDPTILVGGVRSGWEPDYLKALKVRLDCQVINGGEDPGEPEDPKQPEEPEKPPPTTSDEEEEKKEWDAFLMDVVGEKLPKGLKASAQALIKEFILLRHKRSDEDDGGDEEESFWEALGLLKAQTAPVPEVDGGSSDSEKPKKPTKLQMPVFHDRKGRDYEGKPAWRDLWNNTQPWFPLFLEWEVEYTHIDFEDWELAESVWWHNEEDNCHEGRNAKAKLHYGIRSDVDLAVKYGGKKKDDSKNVRAGGDGIEKKPHLDRRRFSGRVLVLPQPSFSLEAKITQLIADAGEEALKPYLPIEECKELKKNLTKFDFLSAPLSGFNSHMLTVEQGNHVKPSIREPGSEDPRFLQEAVQGQAGLGMENLMKMGIESDLTPYGSSKKRPAADEPAAFKPVTHGQFRITKLNIIDKFGQAIHAIDPAPAVDPPRLWPCISDWYAPGSRKEDDKAPNVVEDVKDLEKKHKCEYIQVPPQLNQPARLNAIFSMPPEPPKKDKKEITATEDTQTSFWRAAQDWDQPIWGWVVVNYANYGVQFFLPSGAFYREVRFGGPNRVQASPEWLPFREPDDPNERGGKQDGGPAAKQLARLVETLSKSESYLTGFVASINTATLSQSPSPSAYAEFRSALIGKPLALTHVGWSLELAGPAWRSHLSKDPWPAKTLYPEPTIPKPSAEAGDGDKDKDDDKYYKFKIKMGDQERSFDGLVGYFVTKKPGDKLEPGDALDLDTMYTHFSGDKPLWAQEFAKISSTSSQTETNKLAALACDQIVAISKNNYPELSAYYIEPDTIDPETYASRTDSQLQVFGALVDPFLPLHAYTGILPVKELSLPTWTWQGPLDKLSAFFHTGPVLVTRDVPDFDNDRQLVQGELPPKVVEKQAKGEAGVGLPGGALGQWSWLQPYMVIPEKKAPGTSGAFGDDALTEKFMPLAVDVLDDGAKLERGPYTALEGYLQMAAASNEGKKDPTAKEGAR